MKPVDVSLSLDTDFAVENKSKDTKFKVVDYVKISKYKNIFKKVYKPSWSEEVFVIKKDKNTVTWAYVMEDLNGEEAVRRFYKK